MITLSRIFLLAAQLRTPRKTRSCTRDPACTRTWSERSASVMMGVTGARWHPKIGPRPPPPRDPDFLPRSDPPGPQGPPQNSWRFFREKNVQELKGSPPPPSYSGFTKGLRPGGGPGRSRRRPGFWAETITTFIGYILPNTLTSGPASVRCGLAGLFDTTA